MTTYAIGDLQGCCSEFETLLQQIPFDITQDKLWLVGDIVNRGPRSLASLQTAYERRDHLQIVLGNHDLHLLAVAAGIRSTSKGDTLDEILQADQAETLLNWLRHQPLVYHDPSINHLMVHAGLHPAWTLEQAKDLAEEIHQSLISDNYVDFLDKMFSKKSNVWSDNLSPIKRQNFALSCMTRMRFCHNDGRLNLKFKGKISDKFDNISPWFDLPHQRAPNTKIVFGHWAALGLLQRDDVLALDTGCVWGGALTAVSLDAKQQVFSVDCTNIPTKKQTAEKTKKK